MFTPHLPVLRFIRVPVSFFVEWRELRYESRFTFFYIMAILITAAKPGGLFGGGTGFGATAATPAMGQSTGLQMSSAFSTPASQMQQQPQTPGGLSASTATSQLTHQGAYPMLTAVKKQEQLRQQQQQQQPQRPKEPEKKLSVTASPHYVYTPPSATRIRARAYSTVRGATGKWLCVFSMSF